MQLDRRRGVRWQPFDLHSDGNQLSITVYKWEHRNKFSYKNFKKHWSTNCVKANAQKPITRLLFSQAVSRCLRNAFFSSVGNVCAALENDSIMFCRFDWHSRPRSKYVEADLTAFNWSLMSIFSPYVTVVVVLNKPISSFSAAVLPPDAKSIANAAKSSFVFGTYIRKKSERNELSQETRNVTSSTQSNRKQVPQLVFYYYRIRRRHKPSNNLSTIKSNSFLLLSGLRFLFCVCVSRRKKKQNEKWFTLHYFYWLQQHFSWNQSVVFGKKRKHSWKKLSICLAKLLRR